LESPCNPLSDLTLPVQFGDMTAAHKASENFLRISSSKFHQKEMHHPTSINWRLTNNQFLVKSDSTFERAELQLLSD
jgi:hypothetical protein